MNILQPLPNIVTGHQLALVMTDRYMFFARRAEYALNTGMQYSSHPLNIKDTIKSHPTTESFNNHARSTSQIWLSLRQTLT